MDVLLIFNSAIIDENYNIIKDRRKIAEMYMAGWFWIDIIAIIPF